MQLWQMVFGALKPAEGKERPARPALDGIRRQVMDLVDLLQRQHEHMAQLGKQSYQIVENQVGLFPRLAQSYVEIANHIICIIASQHTMCDVIDSWIMCTMMQARLWTSLIRIWMANHVLQIQRIEKAKAEEDAFIQDIQDKIIALTPEGMSLEALLQAEADASLKCSRKGGVSASRAGRRSKAKAVGSAALAAPAIVETGELLAPTVVAPHIPSHFVEYTFRFPGKPPFTVCPLQRVNSWEAMKQKAYYLAILCAL
jgi:hypothetical protein